MIGYQIRVVRLLLIIDDHGLDVRQHVLSLPEASILHLALLDAVHAAIIKLSIGTSLVLLVAAPVPLISARSRAHLSVASVDILLHSLLM